MVLTPSCTATCFAARLSFDRLFFSPASHKWQKAHDEPLPQPFVYKKAHGLHAPYEWPLEPTVGHSGDPTTGSDNGCACCAPQACAAGSGHDALTCECKYGDNFECGADCSDNSESKRRGNGGAWFGVATNGCCHGVVNGDWHGGDGGTDSGASKGNGASRNPA